MKKKLTCIVLVICMLLMCVVTGSVSFQAVETEKTTSSASTAAQSKIQGSAILHCFDWSYNSIKSNLQAIRDAGYTAVQTSPVQPPKDYNSNWRDQNGQWWKLYQPLGIRIADSGQSWLGGKNELKSLCTEADKYGIKVIVDIVANHLANKSDGGGYSNLNDGVDGDLKRSEYFHTENYYASDNDRYSMTHGHIGMPDLNTSNSTIQNKYKQLLIDCINVGVDGFRFDAAKHIELPTDSNGGSNFWPTVLNGASASTSNDVYYYGEILSTAATDIKNYTQYMSITDNRTGDSMLVAANNKNSSGLADSSYKLGGAADKAVLWCESHDTYMGQSGSAGMGNTKNVSNDTIIKTWAIVASRADSSALFFARPASNMGDASSDTTWKSTAVAEVNKFKNFFDGQSEQLSSSGDVAYNERGTTGVVISKLSGGGSVSLTAHKMKDGSYKDFVSGGTFTVSGGQIKGNVGSSGVAVVYSQETVPEGPSVSISFNGANKGGSFTDTASVTLLSSNTTSATYKLGSASAVSYKSGDTITIGANMSEGESVTLALSGTGTNGSTVNASYTFTKMSQPTIIGTTTVYYDNSSTNWSTVYVYAYRDNGAQQNASWPGVPMQNLGDNIWGYALDSSWSDAYVIFSDNGNSQSDTGAGHPINQGESKIYLNGSWSDYVKNNPTTAPTTTMPTTAKPTTAPTTTQPQSNDYYGDANGDRVVNIRDATTLQKHIAAITLISGVALLKSDVNSDGNVNIKDVTCIQWYIANVSARAGRTGQIFQ
ncbi:MAG: starch-binding protein [Ruminococcus sp.]|nr:starch-binding protein [Ruminococcus sp.]